MIELANVRAGDRVLDIASGAGQPALGFALAVGRNGHVLATDFVEEMLTYAREKAAQQGFDNIEFRHVDGEVVDVPAGAFDAVTCRWGIIFMPDPLACLRRAHVALKPGGRVVLACWKGPEENPFVAVPLGVLKRHMELPVPPPGAPGIFSFADNKRLEGVMREAGFDEVKLESVSLTMAEFQSGAEYFTYIQELAGPVASLFQQLPADKKARVEQEIISEVEQKYRSDGQVRLGGVTWVAVGVRR